MSTAALSQDSSVDPMQERGNLLYKGLIDGEAECVICTEEIDAETSMWSCQSCHHIYHFSCIKRWAENKRRMLWSCPTCKTPQSGSVVIMTPSCWCGKQRHADINYRGNTCGATCFRIQKCDVHSASPCTGVCRKLCHPGPCDPVTCKVEYPSGRGIPFPKPTYMSLVEPYREMNRPGEQKAAPPRQRLQNRDRSRNPGDAERGTARGGTAPDRYQGVEREHRIGHELRFAIFLISILQAPFLWWFVIRVEKWTRPLQHTHFTEHRRDVEGKASLAMAILWPVFTGLISLMFITKLIAWGFRPRNRHVLPPFLVFIFTTCIGFVLIADMFIIRVEAPAWVWKAQMKDSCRGFDTRVKLDVFDSDRGFVPSKGLEFYTPDLPELPIRQPGVDVFNFTTTFDKTKISEDPFFYYYRMTGILPSSPHLAVDFDLHKNMWRIMNLTYANTSLSPSTAPPLFTQALFKAGTWSQTSKSNPHVLIPELNLQIPNMHYFTRHCAYQPFMKVYSMANLTTDQATWLSNEKWSSNNEKEVVMRTAAFGVDSETDMSICARRNDYEVDGEKMNSLREDVVVPLGLLAALRLQMMDEGKFQKGCNYHDIGGPIMGLF